MERKCLKPEATSSQALRRCHGIQAPGGLQQIAPTLSQWSQRLTRPHTKPRIKCSTTMCMVHLCSVFVIQKQLTDTFTEIKCLEPETMP